MRTFNYSDLENLKLDSDIIFLLGRIHEAKGKQELFLAQKPKELNKLVEITKIQSTEASNDIEGIRTTNTRLKQLLSQKITPRNRAEEEIAGYRDVLSVIHESYEYIPLTSNYILQLHKMLYQRTGLEIGGQFKHIQNYITATDGKGNSYTLFTPLAPYETLEAINMICEQFNKTISDNKVDPLILIPVFIHDFLCIHPFVDGNGRLSRLLTTLLLYRCGYLVGKFISLEAKISQDKNSYYTSLEKSQIGWHEGKDNPTDFIKYLLGTIVSAYRDFEERIDIVATKQNSFAMVKQAVSNTLGKFTKSDIIKLCPSLSIKTVEKHLKTLTDAGEIQKHGAARATFYTKKA
jgi:Fic family protein